MRFQLVLQWSTSSLTDFDEIVNLLIANLTDQSEVDGHDFGSGEANIFILTHDPQFLHYMTLEEAARIPHRTRPLIQNQPSTEPAPQS